MSISAVLQFSARLYLAGGGGGVGNPYEKVGSACYLAFGCKKVNSYCIHNKRPHPFEPAVCIFSSEVNKKPKWHTFSSDIAKSRA